MQAVLQSKHYAELEERDQIIMELKGQLMEAQVAFQSRFDTLVYFVHVRCYLHACICRLVAMFLLVFDSFLKAFFQFLLLGRA